MRRSLYQQNDVREPSEVEVSGQVDHGNTTTEALSKRFSNGVKTLLGVAVLAVGSSAVKNFPDSSEYSSGGRPGIVERITGWIDRSLHDAAQPRRDAESRVIELKNFEAIVDECSESLRTFELLASDNSPEMLAGARSLAQKFQELALKQLYFAKFSPTKEEEVLSAELVSKKQQLCSEACNALGAVLFSQELTPEDRTFIDQSLVVIRNNVPAVQQPVSETQPESVASVSL